MPPSTGSTSPSRRAKGILKHCSVRNARELGDVGERFLKKRRPSLEAQIANLADEIAYNNHDVDDGLRSGLLELEQLCEVAIFERHRAAVLKRLSRARAAGASSTKPCGA